MKRVYQEHAAQFVCICIYVYSILLRLTKTQTLFVVLLEVQAETC